MIARLKTLFDPLVRLLLLAIALATVLPVTGEGRAVARVVSDAAIFFLFLLRSRFSQNKGKKQKDGCW